MLAVLLFFVILIMSDAAESGSTLFAILLVVFDALIGSK